MSVSTRPTRTLSQKRFDNCRLLIVGRCTVGSDRPASFTKDSTPVTAVTIAINPKSRGSNIRPSAAIEPILVANITACETILDTPPRRAFSLKPLAPVSCISVTPCLKPGSDGLSTAPRPAGTLQLIRRSSLSHPYGLRVEARACRLAPQRGECGDQSSCQMAHDCQREPHSAQRGADQLQSFTMIQPELPGLPSQRAPRQ